MSDESLPAPLRLKPRIRVETAGSTPPTPNQPAEVPTEPSSPPQAPLLPSPQALSPEPAERPPGPEPVERADSSFKLKLKPKISLSASTTPATSVPAEPAPRPEPVERAAPLPSPLAPNPSPAAGPSPAEEAAPASPTPMRLRPRMAAESQPAAQAAHTPSPSAPSLPPAAAPEPVERAAPADDTPTSLAPGLSPAVGPGPAAQEPPAPSLPPATTLLSPQSNHPIPPSFPKPHKVPHVRGPELGELSPEPPEPPAAKGAKTDPRKLLRQAAIGLGALLILSGALAAWKLLRPTPTPIPPKPPKASLLPNKPAEPASQAKENLPPQASNPSPATPSVGPISKTQDVVATRRRLEQERIDATMTGRDIPDTRAIPSAPPLQIASTPAPIALAEPPKPQAPSAFVTPTLTTQPIPSDKKSTTEVDSLPQVSAAFRRLVADMKITGVFQGIPPRAHINGRLIRAGDTVDKQLNVIFDSIDQEKKTITFRDEAGATVTRRY